MRTLLVVTLVVLCSCSDSASDAGTTTIGAPATAVPATAGADAALRVDLVREAVAAVEAELGGPQEYYEINATPALVNLFVAGDDGTVTAFAYLAGVLTSEPLVGTAGGATFRAESLDFDPDTVTDVVTAELPESRQDVFEIVGGPEGAVRYSIVVTSSAGGQLIVRVGPDGTVMEVDPV